MSSAGQRLDGGQVRPLLRRQARAAVDAHHLAVGVGVHEQLDHHGGELVGGAEPLREQHVPLQPVLEGLGRLALAVDGVSNSPGATQLSRTPMTARSRATGSVIPTMPPLLAL